MRVVVSAGGTGGHIYPALSIINKIKEKEPNSEFLYIGTHDRMEKNIIPKYGIPFETIEIYGFNRQNVFKNFRTVRSFIKSYKKCKKLIKDFRPDVVIGVGGYVTGPVIYAAYKLGIKTFIHEQNSVPGKANQFLCKYASLVGISFASSQKFFPKQKVVFTGNPCGENALLAKSTEKKEFGLSNYRDLVYIVMGSLGSPKMNDILVKAMSSFKNKPYEVLFVTGRESYDNLSKNDFPQNVKLVPYVENQVCIMKQASIIVSRCGASTLSEIIELGLPSILIPSPYVPNNHQYKNGLDIVNANAGIMIEEKNLNGSLLVQTIDELLKDKKKMESFKANLKKLSVPNSATLIYQKIRKLIDGE